MAGQLKFIGFIHAPRCFGVVTGNDYFGYQRLSEALLAEIRGGSWDLAIMVISTLIGVISSYQYSYPNSNLNY